MPNTPKKVQQFSPWLVPGIATALGISGILLGIWTYGIAHNGMFDWKTLAQDYGANISTTLVSFTIAVLVIDYLNARREEMKWLPSKHILYTQLLNETNEFLINVMPVQSFSKIGINTSLYEFGVSTTDWIQKLDNGWLRTLVESLKGLTDDDGVYQTEQINLLNAKIVNLLNNYQHLLEPELTNLVLPLRKSLLDQPQPVKVSVTLSRKEKKEIHELHLMSLGFHLEAVIIDAVQVMQWLEDQADRAITQEQFLDEFDKHLEEARREIRK